MATTATEELKVTEGAPAENGMMPPEEQWNLPTMEEIVNEEVVKKVLHDFSTEAVFMDYTVELGSKAGDNYAAIIYLVKIRYTLGSSDEKTLTVMLKSLPRNAMRKQFLTEMCAFEKEILMYSKVMPSLSEYEKSKGVQGFAFPTCYSTFMDGTGDYLGLEDMRLKDFKMGNRKIGLDFDHASFVMKHLARFHAISFAKYKGSKDKMLEDYPNLIDKTYKPLTGVNEMMKAWMAQNYANTVQSIEEAGYPEEAATVKRVFVDDMDYFHIALYHLCGPHFTKFPMITHGDCWLNNMLFKYDPENPNKIVDHVFLDFQLSRITSPAIDLTYFLHTSLQMDIMNERFEELLKVYHVEFLSQSEKLGWSVQEHKFTWEALLAEMEQCHYFGAATGLMLAPLLAAESEDVPNMDKMEAKDLEDKNSDAWSMWKKMMKDTAVVKLHNLAKYHVSRVKKPVFSD